MLWLGSPAGNKACHDAPGARGIGLHLQLGTTGFVEGAAFFGRHPEKLLVACGGEVRLKARCDHTAGKLGRALVGLACELPVKRCARCVGAGGVKGGLIHYTHHATLCRELAGALGEVGQALDSAPTTRGARAHHKGLAKEHAVFGATQGKDVGTRGNLLNGKVGTMCHDAACHACAIHIHRQVTFLRPIAERVELGAAIHIAQLACVREVEHAGLRSCSSIGAGGLPKGFHTFRCEGAQRIVRGKQAAPLGLDSTGFVNGGVRIGCAEGAFVGFGKAGDGKNVGRSASRDKGHHGIGLSYFCADELGGVRAMLVGAIAQALLGIGAHKRLEDCGRRALAVIVTKLMHGCLRKCWG